MAVLAVSGIVIASLQHGSMIMPPSRNAVDADLPAWSNGKYPPTGVIEPYTCNCINGSDVCSTGQSCFWFSQGCSIGCKACDGNGSRLPNFDHCPGERSLPIDGMILPKYRTTNIDGEWMGVSDIWKFNPWRAPGKAPLFDPCGMAGGNYVEVFNAGAYNTTVNAKQGDLATKVLKPRPSGTVWKRGSVAAVRWELTAAHGGGYQFQLCPASEELTEECFNKIPLEYATPDQHTVRYANSSLDHTIPATMVTEGGGKGWMIHPIPYATSIPCDYVVQNGSHCPWHCPRCGAPWYAADGACPTACAKEHQELPQDVQYGKAIPSPKTFPQRYSIEDALKVPENIPAGDYVVRYRWDCEATSQIWTTCSDITIA